MDTFKLRKPIDSDGVIFQEFTLRELTVGELVAWDKKHQNSTVMERDVAFFAAMCGAPVEVMRQIGQRDWSKLKDFYGVWADEGNDPEPLEPIA